MRALHAPSTRKPDQLTKKAATPLSASTLHARGVYSYDVSPGGSTSGTRPAMNSVASGSTRLMRVGVRVRDRVGIRVRVALRVRVRVKVS